MKITSNVFYAQFVVIRILLSFIIFIMLSFVDKHFAFRSSGDNSILY